MLVTCWKKWESKSKKNQVYVLEDVIRIFRSIGGPLTDLADALGISLNNMSIYTLICIACNVENLIVITIILYKINNY